MDTNETPTTTRYFFAGDNDDEYTSKEFEWLSEAQAHRDTSNETSYRIGMIHRAPSGRTWYFDVDSTSTNNCTTDEELDLIKWAEEQAKTSEGAIVHYDHLLQVIGGYTLHRMGYN